MQPQKALKQIPFLGKKTKTPDFRRDFWKPLATVSFPSVWQCREAFKQLREFKVRHEHEWHARDLNVKVNYDIAGRPHYDRLDIGKKLLNQKANTVADLAMVCELQRRRANRHKDKQAAKDAKIQTALDQLEEKIVSADKQMKELRPKAIAGDTAAQAKYKSLKADKMRHKRSAAMPRPDCRTDPSYHPLHDHTPMPKRGMRRRMRLRAMLPDFKKDIWIAWTDIADRDLARMWPRFVQHQEMDRGSNKIGESLASLVAQRPVLVKYQEEQKEKRRADYAAAQAAKDTAAAGKEAADNSFLARLNRRLKYGSS